MQQWFAYFLFILRNLSSLNNYRSRIKVFEPFKDISKPRSIIDAMMISSGCVYRRICKPVMKLSRVETIEEAREEYK